MRPRQVAGHDPLVTLWLIYQMSSTLLGWIVLRTRSDTTKEIEILSYVTSSPCSNGERRVRG